MKKKELKKEFLIWCDEPMSANGNDREEMFERIWQEGRKTKGIKMIQEPEINRLIILRFLEKLNQMTDEERKTITKVIQSINNIIYTIDIETDKNIREYLNIK